MFFRCHTQCNTNQRAVSIVHMPVNDNLAPLETCTLTATIVCLDTMLICCCLLNTIIVIIIEFWEFTLHSVVYIISLQINTLLCYTLELVLVLGIGIARGRYYCILDIGCLAWYHSNYDWCEIMTPQCIMRPSVASEHLDPWCMMQSYHCFGQPHKASHSFQVTTHCAYPRRDGRLSWPGWLVTYWDGLPAHRWSPIQVLTTADIE